MLFDVGMISVPSYILHKPSSLTETEFQKIRTHVEVGEEILSSIELKTSIDIPQIEDELEKLRLNSNQ
jgi:HD-GYP domain-containing protein (c-di-GMP phosphodiesterase class II)